MSEETSGIFDEPFYYQSMFLGFKRARMSNRPCTADPSDHRLLICISRSYSLSSVPILKIMHAKPPPFRHCRLHLCLGTEVMSEH